MYTAPFRWIFLLFLSGSTAARPLDFQLAGGGHFAPGCFPRDQQKLTREIPAYFKNYRRLDLVSATWR